MEATASIIAITELCEKLIKYINMRACSMLLLQLRDQIEYADEGTVWSNTIYILKTPLKRLHNALELAAQKLHRKDDMVEKLKWPFKEKKVQKLIETIESEKSLLRLALQNDSSRLLQQINICSRANETHLTELIALLSSQNASVDADLVYIKDALLVVHDSNLRLNESAAHYQTWLNTPVEILFCPGIPGAGKTILTAIVVAELYKRYHQNPDVAVVFYYCDYIRSKEQTVDDILLSIVKQLVGARTPLSANMQNLYKRHEEDQSRSLHEEILHALQDELAFHSKTYLLIDALDECSDGARLLQKLTKTFDAFALNILATSRFIPEIIAEFQEAKTVEIRADESHVEAYLTAHREKFPWFVQSNCTLQDEIKVEIVSAVEGMSVLLFHISMRS
ncbi:hypothetical protein CC86DRAFT_433300 [Ophiobolus disseminans]|uniref:NACHT domain-containing protein n=1 Tax=Ophiobolus disseminans TaxID=1469910 RepID=A0A6A6ZEB7_9PLEO|nr:hypothetical protein CC86DRAFT_433300 [Ophiobolus disseminans]